MMVAAGFRERELAQRSACNKGSGENTVCRQRSTTTTKTKPVRAPPKADLNCTKVWCSLRVSTTVPVAVMTACGHDRGRLALQAHSCLDIAQEGVN